MINLGQGTALEQRRGVGVPIRSLDQGITSFTSENVRLRSNIRKQG